jgi:ABC-type nitrate/sulfonate/bicarbonate transport system substrate-binding protein
MLIAGREALPNYVRLCVMMMGRTLSEQRETAAHFIAAQIEALRYAVAHRDETIALTRHAIEAKADDPRAAFAFDDSVRNKSIDPELLIPMDKLQWMQAEFVKTGNLQKPGALSKIVDGEIRAKALELARR